MTTDTVLSSGRCRGGKSGIQEGRSLNVRSENRGSNQSRGTKMLSFTIYKLGSTTLFRCAGRFISGDGERLRDAVLNHAHAKTVVLDLAELQGIDAAGVGMLVSLHLWAQNMRIALKLMNLTPRVEEVLELTNVKAEFDVCSLVEMLDLLCDAIRQDRSSAAAKIEMAGNRGAGNPRTDETVPAQSR
jgi:anti-sigma B factor antagonist